VPPIHRRHERQEPRIDVQHGQAYHGRTRTQTTQANSTNCNGLASRFDAPVDARTNDALRSLVRVLARHAAREVFESERAKAQNRAEGEPGGDAECRHKCEEVTGNR